VRGMASCNCTALRQAGRHLTQFYAPPSPGTGFASPSTRSSNWWRSEGPLTISELAEWLVMDRTTIGRNLWPLEREGLIDIRVARHDRRAREVTLSESGREREAEARPAWQRAQDHFEREFDSGRATKMRREMLAIVETALSTPK
jgi:DNA-binding MarR family transcriptional regulator